MKAKTTEIYGLALLMSLVTGLVACKTRNNESKTASNSSYSVPVTLYDPGAFPGGCYDNPDGVPQNHQIAPSEGMFGISCKDNWKKIDINNPPDVEGVDMAQVGASSKKGYIEMALNTCGGTCVKKENGSYFVNLPHCQIKSICAKKETYSVTIGGTTKKAYIHSVCPKRHWKNYFKGKKGIGNPCEKPHLDLTKGFAGTFGIGHHNQNKKTAQITKGSSGGQNGQGQRSQSGSGSCSDKKPPNNNCQQAKSWGQCQEDWLKKDGYCKKTCGRC